jgi:restriction endonuclease Mrr
MKYRRRDVRQWQLNMGCTQFLGSLWHSIFVTTSSFTSSAVQTAKDLSHRIVLIDGFQLAKLMIRYNIGCRDQDIIHVKKIDEDYFDSK